MPSPKREKAETERWFFIADWCKKKGISPMNADNFNRAATEWANLNCFDRNAKDRSPIGAVGASNPESNSAASIG